MALKSLRFLLAGALNTAITYVIYLVLLRFVGYVAAFTITFVLGIALGYALNLLFVFKSAATGQSLLAYPALYLANYLGGLGLIALLIEITGLPKEVAPLVSTAILTPVMFLLSSKIFKPREGAPS